MDNLRRITAKCPKCNRHNTYDMIPEIPNEPWLQLSPLEYEGETISLGNARYYCIDCEYKWKKYRGKSQYERIKVIYANVGGFPGPYYNVKADLVEKVVQHQVFPFDGGSPIDIDHEVTKEDMAVFLAELHKCDFINWAEEYHVCYPVMDGTNWSVRIEYDTHCEIKYGSNHFPPKWTKFCKAISRLSGSDFS